MAIMNDKELNEIYEMINSRDLETIKLGAALLSEYSTENKFLLEAKKELNHIIYAKNLSLETIAYVNHILWLILKSTTTFTYFI